MLEHHIDNLALFRFLWDKLETKPKPEKKMEKHQKIKLPLMARGKSAGKPRLSYFSTSDKMVALCIAHHRNPATLKCCPGYGRISRETGISKKTIGKAIDSLERARVLWRFKVYEDNELKRTQYFFMADSCAAKGMWEDEDSPLSKAQSTDGIEQFIKSLEIPF